MSQENKKPKLMKELLGKEQQNPALPQAGDLLEGRILKITNTELLVDLGPIGTGVIYGAELKENREMIKELKPGQTISALVLDPENDDGYVELSLKEANLEKAWMDIKAKKQNNELITVQIIEANRGGLVIRLSGIIGFLPVSQLSPQNYPRVEGGDKNKILQHLNQFVGKEMQVKIIGLDKESDKLIVSEKAALEKQNEESLKKYKKGDVIEGKVTALTDFGAFIKFADNLEGLAHISELDWQIIDHPSQVLKENEEIKAKIIEIDRGQVFLSLKALKADPWQKIEGKYTDGQQIRGKVIKFNPAGAFVEIAEGVYGLMKTSEFSKRNQMMRDMLTLGNSYNFEILSLAPEEHKMSLALADE